MDLKFFKLGVSTARYTTKPNFKNVRYNTRENIGTDKMVELIREGYSFTHTFSANGEYGNKEKTIPNFKQTNYIWLDFDDCIDSINNIYQRITYKPNIAYTTISNLQNGKSNRFRLIYMIDFQIYSNDDYKYYLNLLLNTIIKDLGKDYLKYIDNNCFNVSQQMFGSNDKSTIITNDSIYSKTLFKYISEIYTIENLLNKIKCSKNLKSNNKEREKILTQNEGITTSLSELIELLQSSDIKTYQPILTNENLAILDTNDIYTNVAEQDIYKINFLYDKNNKIRKIKKGYRNNTLFVWGVTIKNINPIISIEELAKSLYWLYIYRCEKSDDFGMYQVSTIAISAYKANLNNYKELGKRKYIINPDNKELSRAEKVKALGRAKRKTRDKYILGNYDVSKSVKENAKDLGVAEGTIRNSFKDNDINHQSRRNMKGL